jgi:hypothetical protein
MKSFLNIVYLFVGVSACSILFLLFRSGATSEEVSEKNIDCCGTTALQVYSNFGNVREGKKLFRNQCAPCHAKNMQKDMTGPALEGSLNRWNRDSTQIQLYLSDSPTNLDTTTNPRLIDLRENWKPTISHKYQLSMQEVKDIMSYTEGNS